ncbi:glutaminase A [Thalassotalea ponticola]|uniref:glutaminase A n=1 Tax=Thalassotalea ponticola TaxID=1523392 RepID=UPI0025B57348|nr:glutaminase A [Thalassotalea ponticola]MDN3651827.1 glutaminase A [Thalassotalea ponticola]
MFSRWLLIITLLVPVSACAQTSKDVDINAILASAHSLYKMDKTGANADYIPALAEVDSELFGIALVTTDGKVYSYGDVEQRFSIQSISKVFTLALALEQQGADTVAEKVGVNASGMPFNSIIAIELNQARSINPLVNAGAMATMSLLDGNETTKWQRVASWYNEFANAKLPVLDAVYQSETETNDRNLAIAQLLKAHQRFYGDVAMNLDLYTRQCSIGVTAKDLAIMTAPLANNGKHPITNKQLMSEDNVEHLLAVMSTAGLYETSGDWAYKVGLPAKSGVGGGIIAVAPGQFSIAVFSPRLDSAGNSVRAQKAIDYIAEKLGANVF